MNSSYGIGNFRVVEEGEIVVPAFQQFNLGPLIQALEGDRISIYVQAIGPVPSTIVCIGIPSIDAGFGAFQYRPFILIANGPVAFPVTVKWSAVHLRISNT